MFRRPDETEVRELSTEIGLDLTGSEIRIMGSRMAEAIDALETFYEMRIEEQSLPLDFLNRDPGHRPTDDEDPLNAFIRKCRVEGAASGPLKGKTIGLKDHIAVAGIPLTFGSHLMDGYIPDFDATIVNRVLSAGGTITGKLNMEDFSFGGPGISGVGDYGRPLNPHNHDFVTGGSSSGAGAAVAGGYVDIAFGGDQGGSVRIPAAWCGIVGIIATHGLIPHTGVFGLDPTVDFTGPMARTVEDVATVFQCVAGADGFDPRQVNLPSELPDYVGALSRGVDGLRIGVLSEGFGLECSEGDVDDAVMEAVSVLERAGATARRVSVPLHSKAFFALMPIYMEGGRQMVETNLGGAFAKTFYPGSLMATFGRLRKGSPSELPANVKLNLLMGTYLQQRYHGRLYAKASNVRPTFVRQYDEVFSDVDLLVMPTTPFKPWRWKEHQNYEQALEHTIFGGEEGPNLRDLVANCGPFNLTGHPAITVPCGKSEGLPIGMMLVAPYFREDLLFQASNAYEQLVNWSQPSRVPAVHGV